MAAKKIFETVDPAGRVHRRKTYKREPEYVVMAKKRAPSPVAPHHLHKKWAYFKACADGLHVHAHYRWADPEAWERRLQEMRRILQQCPTPEAYSRWVAEQEAEKVRAARERGEYDRWTALSWHSYRYTADKEARRARQHGDWQEVVVVSARRVG